MTMFLAPGLVMLFFTAVWIVRYPESFLNSLTFRNREGIKGHLISAVTIVWIIGGAATLIWLAEFLTK